MSSNSIKLYWGFNGRETTSEKVAMCVGPGWRLLVLKLIEDLLSIGWDAHVFQVKEKFGGLRFYASAMSNEGYDLIHKAEEQSYTICEECGEPGQVYRDGWWKTLCEKHAKEQQRELCSSGC